MPSQDLTVKLKAENQDLKRKLADSKAAIKEMERSVREAGRAGSGGGWKDMLGNLAGLKTGASGANGALGLLTGGLGKLAGGLGIAMGAAEFFNTVLDNSNSLGDQFEKVTMQAGAAVDYFAASLAQADFSSFISGLINSIDAAGDLADILDDLNTRQQQLDVTTSAHAVEIAKLTAEAAKYERGSKKRLELEKEIVDLRTADADKTSAHAQDQKAASVKMMRVAIGAGEEVSDSFIQGLTEHYAFGEVQTKGLEKTGELLKAIAARNGAEAGSAYRNTLSKEIEKHAKEIGGKNWKAYMKAALRLREVSDNGNDTRGTQIRKTIRDANHKEASAINEKATAQEKLTRETKTYNRALEAGRKAGAGTHKSVQLVYNATARTVAAMRDNVRYLQDMQDETDPVSEKFSQITDEIREWQKQLDKIDMSKLRPGSKAYMQAGLSQQTSIRDNAAPDTKEWIDADYRVRQLQASIEKLGAEENKIHINEVKWESKAYNEVTKKVRYLQQMLEQIDWAADPVNYEATKEALDAARKELQGPPPLKDSIAEITEELQELENQYRRTGDAAQRMNLRDRMKQSEKKLEKTEKGYNVSDVFTREPDQDTRMKLESYDAASARVRDIQDSASLGIIDRDAAKAQIQEINDELKKLGIDPITVDIQTPGLKKTLKAVNQTADAVGSLGAGLSTLGSAFETPELEVAGIIAQSIANIALATSQAIAEAASLGPFGWIAFGAAAMAEMAAMIAQIHSATGMASGGIVQGSSYTGDQVVTRLNSGEMVLNRRQQSHLFDALDSGLTGGGGGGPYEVEWRLRGSDLYGSVRNWSRQAGKAGRKTGIR